LKAGVQDRILAMFSWGCALVLVSGLAAVLGFLLVRGAPALSRELIFGSVAPLDALLLKRQVFYGIFPAVAGTVCLVVFSIGTALPVGLCAGIWLAEYAPRLLKQIFSLVVDILAGIPSIVVGLFGFSITIFLHHFLNNRVFPCLLISALALAFLVLPYIIKTTQTAMDSLPLALRLTAPSLGASRLENIVHVLVPAALPDLASGVILAIGRCAEDTAVIMLTGVVATAGIPKSIFSSYEALPFYIYYTASEYADASELVKAYGAALVLLLICAGLFGLAHLARVWVAHRARVRT
jgi:phosphate transport system permease protein